MMIKTMLLSAASALVLSASAASAAPATAEADVNMRSGPGTEYGVVTTIPAGAPVDVGSCNGSWCAVSYGRNSGYTSRNYLGTCGRSGPSVGVAVAAAPGYAYDDGPYYDDYDDYGYGYGPGLAILRGPRLSPSPLARWPSLERRSRLERWSQLAWRWRRPRLERRWP